MITSPQTLSACRVLVVGDAMLDRYWFGSVERISPEAPVQVVRVHTEEDRLGGAANVALNIRMLGAQTTLLCLTGQDEAARRLRETLHHRGIEALLCEDPAHQTIVKLRVIGRSQQLIRLDFEQNAHPNAQASLLDAFEHALPAHDLVLFSDYGKGGLAQISQMIGKARQADKLVLVDPKGHDYSAYAGATAITPNCAELAQVIGPWQDEEALQQRAQALRNQLGLEALLLTRSEDGMSVFDADGFVHVPAQSREVYDVTGAGDTVIATLAALLACGLPIREAMAHANRAAGIVVGKFGTAHVSYEELFPC